MISDDSSFVVLINQPAGLGDIFFLQKAAKYFSDDGIPVIWPIEDHFMYLNDYINHSGIFYYPKTQEFPHKKIYKLDSIFETYTFDEKNKKNVLYVPFVHAEHTMMNMPNFESAMKCKYDFVQIDRKGWQEYFSFTRNYTREQQLRDYYKIKENEEFIFVNDLFASPPNMIRRNIKIDTNIRVIYNDGSPCHIFDFCWIFENAKEIHTIESAFCYIIEKLNTTDKLYMYSRKVNGFQQHPNFNYINGIHEKSWTKIYD